MKRTRPVRTRGLTHVALAVRDPHRSLHFYRAVLGVVPVYEQDDFVQVQTPGSWDVHRLRAQTSRGRKDRWHRPLRIPASARRRHRTRNAAVHAAGGTIRDTASLCLANRTCSSLIPTAMRSRSGTSDRLQSIRRNGRTTRNSRVVTSEGDNYEANSRKSARRGQCDARCSRTAEQCLAAISLDDSQPAPGDGTLDYGHLEAVVEIRYQRGQVGDQGVVVEGRENRGADEQRCLGQAARSPERSTMPAAHRERRGRRERIRRAAAS